jgi:antitoxin (DNA-binding transcriptional repressor) of toxin-antitoxin stability system
MKTVSVSEAQAQLPQLIAQALDGDVVVLTDGDKQVRLEPYDPADPRTRFDPGEDGAELEAELLKAVRGPHAPYSREELRAVADQALREHRSGVPE